MRGHKHPAARFQHSVALAQGTQGLLDEGVEAEQAVQGALVEYVVVAIVL